MQIACQCCLSPATASPTGCRPGMQQVEHFANPTITVNDAFKAVTRYWDRITHPAQIIRRYRRP